MTPRTCEDSSLELNLRHLSQVFQGLHPGAHLRCSTCCQTHLSLFSCRSIWCRDTSHLRRQFTRTEFATLVTSLPGTSSWGALALQHLLPNSLNLFSKALTSCRSIWCRDTSHLRRQFTRTELATLVTSHPGTSSWGALAQQHLLLSSLELTS